MPDFFPNTNAYDFWAPWKRHSPWCMSACRSHTDKGSCRVRWQFSFFLIFFFFLEGGRGQLSRWDYYVKATHQVCLTCLFHASDVLLHWADETQRTGVCTSLGWGARWEREREREATSWSATSKFDFSPAEPPGVKPHSHSFLDFNPMFHFQVLQNISTAFGIYIIITLGDNFRLIWGILSQFLPLLDNTSKGKYSTFFTLPNRIWHTRKHIQVI